MSTVMDKTATAWTEAELSALPDNGHLHEVVQGELVMSPKNNFQHERICKRLNFALASFNRAHRLGAVFGSSMGFWMTNRNCRTPDVAFVPKARLQHLGFKPDTRTFFPGAPDLAAEVLSPGNTRSEMDERLADYFASGAQIVYIIHPDEAACGGLPLPHGSPHCGPHRLPGRRTPPARLPFPGRRLRSQRGEGAESTRLPSVQ